MKRLGLVKAATLAPFLRFLAANGIDIAPQMRKANIAPELVEHADTWLAKQQVYTLLSDISDTNNMPALGLMVGDQICVADLGPLGEKIYACDTLDGACQMFAALIPQFADGNRATLHISDNTARFSYQTTDHRKGNRDHADHYGLMMLLSIVRLTAPRFYPKDVTLQTGACDAFSAHPAWAETQVTFDAPQTGFAFPAEWLSREIPSPPNAFNTQLDAKDNTGAPVSFTESLELVLGAYLAIGGMPTLDRLAESLNMSPRTLKRRLGDEGETYRQFSDRVRIKAAERMLEDAGTSVNQVAYALGYSGANNFSRAFKRIRGRSPKAVRESS